MTKRCTKCARPLLVNGIHMGIPFAIDRTLRPGDAGMHILVCGKCYDTLTVDPDTKVAK